MRKGLTVNVYRTNALGPGVDYSLGGISARADQLTITGVVEVGGSGAEFAPLSRHARVFEPNAERPEAWLLVRPMHASRPAWYVIPAMPDDFEPGLNYWVTLFAFGGNYAAHSEVWELTEVYGALAVHDRREN
jgi:hypothetical protein